MILVAVVVCPHHPEGAVGQARLQLLEGYLEGGFHARGDQFEVATQICNGGDEELLISDVSSPCPCIEVASRPHSVGAGECANLALRMQIKRERGDQVRDVIITTNDRRRPRSRLRLGFTVDVHARASPSAVWFGTIKPGETVEATVRIESLLGGAGRILYATCDEAAFRPLVVEPVVASRQPGQVRIELRAPEETGVLGARVYVYTSVPEVPVVEVPVKAVISRALAGPLRNVDLGLIPAGSVGSVTVPLELGAGIHPAIIKTRPKNLTARLEEAGGEGLVNLCVRYEVGDEYGPFRGRVTLATTGTEELRFHIPVSGRVVPGTVLWPEEEAAEHRDAPSVGQAEPQHGLD